MLYPHSALHLSWTAEGLYLFDQHRVAEQMAHSGEYVHCILAAFAQNPVWHLLAWLCGGVATPTLTLGSEIVWFTTSLSFFPVSWVREASSVWMLCFQTFKNDT